MAIGNGGEEDDHEGGVVEQLVKGTFIGDHHSKRNCTPETSNNDEGLPLPVDGALSVLVDDGTESTGDEDSGDDNDEEHYKSKVPDSIETNSSKLTAKDEEEDIFKYDGDCVDDVAGEDGGLDRHVPKGVPLLGETVGDESKNVGESKDNGETIGQGSKEESKHRLEEC